MLIITAIMPRRKHLCGIKFSEEYIPEGARTDATGLLALDSDYIEEIGLKEGQEYEYSDIERMVFESDKRRAKNKALWLISRRDYSSNEMLKKLSEEFSFEASQSAVAKMCELSFIDDRRYAKHLAEKLIDIKGFAPKSAKFEMMKKGIDRELAEEILMERDDDPRESVKMLIEEKYKKYLVDEKGTRKVINALLRKGFSYGDIRTALEPYIEDNYGDYNED